MTDLISVIVPVYNVEQYLQKCVESLVNQSYKNLEIILVDDGSDDNSGQLCDSLAEKYSNIKVLHKNNGGLSDARNKGLEYAKGNYIFFVDSDDWIELETIEKLYNAIKENDADISICGINDYAGGKIKVTRGPSKELSIYNSIKAIETLISTGNEIGIVVWNKLYKKSLFDNVIFEFGKLHEDVFFTPKILFFAKKIVAINYCGYNYITDRQGSICNKKLSYKNIDAPASFLSNYEFFKEQSLDYFSKHYFLKYMDFVMIVYAKAVSQNNEEIKLELNKQFKANLRKGIKYAFELKNYKMILKFIVFSFSKKIYNKISPDY